MNWTEKILHLSVVTDKKLIAAEGASSFLVGQGLLLYRLTCVASLHTAQSYFTN